MTVLVTGGAGYVGSHTVRMLREEGIDVLVLDDFSTGSVDALLGCPHVHGDVGDSSLLDSLFKNYEVSACLHFAAHKNVGESMRDPAKYWKNNVSNSLVLIESLANAGVSQMIFSSSCSIFGNPDHVPVQETFPVRPESVYAETKVAVERILHWYARTRSVSSISLRYFNAAGAAHDGVIGENWGISANLIPVALKCASRASGQLQIFGDDFDTPDGTCIRDYVHVEDLAAAHVAALRNLESEEKKGVQGKSEAFNLGTGRGASVLEVVECVESITGLRVSRRVVQRREGDPAAIWADPDKAYRVLGWKAHRSLSDSIQSAWDWHSKSLA